MSEHRIIELEGFDAVGLSCECPGGDISAIGPLWDDFFGAKSQEVPGSLGIVGVSWGNGAGGFGYMAAHKVASGAGEAAALMAGSDYASRTVPGGRYIGVQWSGKGGSDMSSAFQDLFNRIIPEAGEQVAADGVCVEDYPNEGAWDPETQTLRAELQVKVEG
jgi:hypothetical protein